MRRVVLLTAIAIVIGSCSGGDSIQVRVSTAASLHDVFGEMEAVFEEENPGVDILINLGGSSTLREQILSGAPVDVFAPADLANMGAVAVEIDVEPLVFATNEMAIAVPLGNPGSVSGVEDLAREELFVGLCSEPVPCGALGREVLDNAGVEPSIDSNEPNVRSLLTKIEAGELDVGIVYATDVLSTPGVEGIDIPGEWNEVTELPIAVLPGGGEAAAGFVEFVTSERGREILAAHGFGPP